MLAPICLFTYNRPEEVKQTICALKNNFLSKKSKLYIFSDGYKGESDINQVKEVRNLLKNIDGFAEVVVYESDINKGLAESVISGVSMVLKENDSAIVLEDDLLTSRNFLTFMNQAIEFYVNSNNIFSISGYTLDLPGLKTYERDYYFGYRASSWGWATWKDRWNKIDWDVKDYNIILRSPLKQIKFMKGGSDLPYMLWKQMNGKIDSWAIRWCFNQFQSKTYTVFPKKSKIESIGFGASATHTKKTTRFNTLLDDGDQQEFEFEEFDGVDKNLAKQFRNKFSIKNRLLGKIW
ncbi:sugar transferase [Carboxylicivirga linearis]|uniref:Sugar transferase n=1 Tax=Carboxylicivirga linearis TaxID=1628157 RepID=A0ABS5JQE9_9BACT|nr:sugar transferase [Carboxylicivirga linearis]MBS2097108.1 sugar transferase [Carboxylicivirga linearis]